MESNQVGYSYLQGISDFSLAVQCRVFELLINYGELENSSHVYILKNKDIITTFAIKILD